MSEHSDEPPSSPPLNNSGSMNHGEGLGGLEDIQDLPDAESQDRVLGKKRTWDGVRWGKWINIMASDATYMEDHVEIHRLQLNLNRGGPLNLYPNILPSGELEVIQDTMSSCRLYRQYKFHTYLEPRVHVMLSKNASSNEGYNYHSVKMKSIPIECVREVERLEHRWSRCMGLQEGFSIGVDLICYRNGMDSIGWHADDTQEESQVLGVVVESKAQRPVCIRPKGSKSQYRVGDEEVELYVGEGDGYELTSGIQENYEHSLPKRKEISERRMCMIFRHGRRKDIQKDSGNPCDPAEWRRFGLSEAGGVSECLNSMLDEVVERTHERAGEIFRGMEGRCGVNFGHPGIQTGVIEGSITSRTEIYQIFAHNSDQRGVSGNLVAGADAVVVARVDCSLRERDGLSWLRYTSLRRQGGGAMAVSCLEGRPIRVFRSSSASDTMFRPIIHEKKSSGHQAAALRYDGIYKIVRMIDNDGNETKEIPGPESEDHHPQWTFILKRAPTKDEYVNKGCWKDWDPEYCNFITLKELWKRMQTLNRETKIQEEIPYVSFDVDMVMSKVDFTSKIIESCMGDMLSFIERDEDDVLLNPPAPETYSVEWLKEKRTQWRYERLQRRNHDGDPNKTNDLTRARKVLLPEGEMLRREKELFDLGVRVSSLTNLDIEGKGHDMWLRAHERWHAAGALTDMLLDLEERETNTRDSVTAALDDIVDEVVIRRKEIERSEDETEISANFQDWLKKRKQQWKRGRLSSMLIAYKDGLGRLGEVRGYTKLRNSILAEDIRSSDPFSKEIVSVSVNGELMRGVKATTDAWSRIKGARLVRREKLKQAMREWHKIFLKKVEQAKNDPEVIAALRAKSKKKGSKSSLAKERWICEVVSQMGGMFYNIKSVNGSFEGERELDADGDDWFYEAEDLGEELPSSLMIGDRLCVYFPPDAEEYVDDEEIRWEVQGLEGMGKRYLCTVNKAVGERGEEGEWELRCRKRKDDQDEDEPVVLNMEKEGGGAKEKVVKKKRKKLEEFYDDNFPFDPVENAWCHADARRLFSDDRKKVQEGDKIWICWPGMRIRRKKRPPPRRHRPAKKAAKKKKLKPPQPPVKEKEIFKFKAGDRVEARWEGWKACPVSCSPILTRYPGVIKNRKVEGGKIIYRISFDDGTKDDRVLEDHISIKGGGASDRIKDSRKRQRQPIVKIEMEEEVCGGEAVIKKRVKVEAKFKVEAKKEAKRAAFSKGDKVEARWNGCNGGRIPYFATVLSAGRKSRGGGAVYDLHYDDGDDEFGVDEEHVWERPRVRRGRATKTQAVTPSPKRNRERRATAATFEEGDEIEAIWDAESGRTKYYNGRVKGVEKVRGGNVFYHLVYEDGEEEEGVAAKHVKKRGKRGKRGGEEGVRVF